VIYKIEGTKEIANNGKKPLTSTSDRTPPSLQDAKELKHHREK
jgi:hypothetical protein